MTKTLRMMDTMEEKEIKLEEANEKLEEENAALKAELGRLGKSETEGAVEGEGEGRKRRKKTESYRVNKV